MIPALSELPFFCLLPTLTMGDGREARLAYLNRKNKFCIHSLSPNLPLCPSLMDNGPAFPLSGKATPSQLPWQCRPLPVN